MSHVQLRYTGWIQQVYADSTYKLVQKGEKLFTVYSPEIAATEQEYLMARENRDESARPQHRKPGVASGIGFFVERSRSGAPEAVADSRSRHRATGKRRCGVPKEIEIDSPVSASIITAKECFSHRRYRCNQGPSSIRLPISLRSGFMPRSSKATSEESESGDSRPRSPRMRWFRRAHLPATRECFHPAPGR